MLRHVVMFRWIDPLTDAHLREVRDALDTLPGQVPSIRAYAHGPDLRLAEGSWDYVIVADFDDATGWLAYDEHPAHAKVRAEVIAPIVDQRAAVRFEL